MRGVGRRRTEFVLITDALAFIESQTGFAFERRQFTRYVEAGAVMINASVIEPLTLKVGERWFVSRPSIEVLIKAIRVTYGGEPPRLVDKVSST